MSKKGFLLILSTAVISGFSIFINKYSVSVINPYVFTWLKNIIVAALLIGVICLMKDWKILKNINPKQWILLVLIGLIGGAIPFLLFFKGLQITTAAWGSLIHKTMFIYAIVFAAVFLKEKISKNLLIAGSLLFLGNIFLIKFTPHYFNAGDILILIAAMFWAGENILSKYLLKNLTPNIVAASRMFFGSIFILGFLGATSQLTLLADLDVRQIGWTTVTAVMLFGYVMTWYHGLKYVAVSQATIILLTGAFITTALSFAQTGTISPKETIGAAFILTGLLSMFGIRHIFDKMKLKFKSSLN